MWAPHANGSRDERPAQQPSPLAITDGEINFLWSFIQGSIMDPDTWRRLLDSYGFCERHAWIHISIETAFRDEYLLGPTILYQALVEKGLRAILQPRISTHSTIRRLRASDACMLCALNIAQASGGAASPKRLGRGRDVAALQSVASELEALWRAYVCGICAGREEDADRQPRCRRHVLSDISKRRALDFGAQRELLAHLHERITRYQNSFLADGRKAADQDRAALLGAIGWCSGWRPLLGLLR
jgi:hypothetical protein